MKFKTLILATLFLAAGCPELPVTDTDTKTDVPTADTTDTVTDETGTPTGGTGG